MVLFFRYYLLRSTQGESFIIFVSGGKKDNAEVRTETLETSLCSLFRRVKDDENPPIVPYLVIFFKDYGIKGVFMSWDIILVLKNSEKTLMLEIIATIRFCKNWWEICQHLRLFQVYDLDLGFHTFNDIVLSTWLT